MNIRKFTFLVQFFILMTSVGYAAQLPPSFNLVGPSNGTAALIEGSSNNTVTINWNATGVLAGTASYNWVADTTGGTFANPIVIPAGTDTSLILTYGTIADLLDNYVSNIGDTLTLDWTVIANDGTDTTAALQTFTITLVRGVVRSNFNLLTPTNGSSTTVQGSPFQTLDFVWQSAGVGVVYDWQLITSLGGNFNSPIYEQVTGNGGLDTVLRIPYSVINQIYTQNSIPNGMAIPLQWRVRASAGPDSNIVSNNAPFSISVTKGVIDPSFDLLTPTNSASLIIGGDSNQTVDITWRSADALFGNPGSVYSWVYDINAPGILSNNNGADTVLTLSYTEIKNLLNSVGIAVGQSVSLDWTIQAENGGNSGYAEGFRNINLTNGVFSNFDLLAPANNSVATIEGSAANEIQIEWEASSPDVISYTWLADAPNGDFSNALLSFNTGSSTILDLSYADIDAILDAYIQVGDTLDLIWTVQANFSNDTIQATSVWNISLIRGNLISDFDQISPANNITLNVQGSAFQTAQITWESAGSAATYSWELDLASGGSNFISPIVSVPSNNSGSDTVLTLDFATIDQVLQNAGVAPGDTANLIWQIKAFYAGDSLVAANAPYQINLIRGNLNTNFDLLSPANGISLNISGNSNQTATITWESAAVIFVGGTTTYEWIYDINSPGIASNNGGSDTSLTLGYQQIDALLASNAVAVGDSITLYWTVLAKNGSDSVFASSNFQITLIRGIFTNYNLISPANNTVINVSGYAQKTATATWQAAQFNPSTYLFMLDLTSGNYSNPLVVAPTGTDTSISITYADMLDLLISQGANNGQSRTFKWTVAAVNGLDTIFAESSRNIILTRGIVIDDFSPTAPASGTSATISGNFNYNITASWERAGIGANYRWLLDTAATFDSPVANLLSNIAGSDTNITLTYAAIDNILASVGMNIGDTRTFNWTVRSIAGGDTVFASPTFTVTFTRGALINNIVLLAPNNNANILIAGLSENVITPRWRQAGNGLTYIWELDYTTNTFASPFLTVNTGLDTSLSFTYAQLEDLFIANGIGVGSLQQMHWRIRATNGTDTLNSTPRGIRLTRQIVIRPFDLISPASPTSVVLEGRYDKQIIPSWERSSKGSASYTFQLDTITGSFGASVILSQLADNSGQDTTRTLSYGAVNTLLSNNGIAQGSTFGGRWRVRASGGAANRISLDTFNLSLTRGILMYPYNLTFPLNNSIIVLQGTDTNVFPISWNGAGSAGVNYEFLLDLASGNFSSPLISQNVGTDSTFNPTIGTLHALLASLGITAGNTANLKWTVRAFAAGDTLAATDTFNLNLRRGTLLTDFDLLSPSNNSNLVISGLGTQTANIDWSNGADGNRQYQWLLDVQGGNFSNPLATIQSNNNGFDEQLTLTYSQIDNLLKNLGYGVGDTAKVQWTVRVNGGGSRLATNGPFNINLIRGTVLNEFNLITPPDNTSLTVAGASSNTVFIDWSSSGDGNIAYTWLLDVAGGNFSNPIHSVLTGQGGLNSSLVLTYADIDAVLDAAGVASGSTVNLIWTVRAVGGAADRNAANGPYALNLTRGDVLNPFQILTPANNTFAAIEGDGSQTVDITWQSAGLGNYVYEWVLDLKGGNFAPPLATIQSNNNGSNTDLTLTYSQINNLLNSLGINVGDTVFATWSVTATDGNDILRASNAFDITFRRGVISKPFSLIGPANNAILTIPDNSNSSITVSWQNADVSGSKNHLNYSWIIDLASGDFTNPLATLPASNGGKETQLQLPFSAITNLLSTNGILAKDTAFTKWTVRATEGNQVINASAPFFLNLIRVEPLGLYLLEFENSIAIYPNPASKSTILEHRNGKGEIHYQITDINGKLIQPMISNNAHQITQIDLSGYSSGLYFIQIIRDDISVTKKLIVK